MSVTIRDMCKSKFSLDQLVSGLAKRLKASRSLGSCQIRHVTLRIHTRHVLSKWKRSRNTFLNKLTDSYNLNNTMEERGNRQRCPPPCVNQHVKNR